mgnify:CR=1 FL=1
MNILDMLDELQRKAQADETLRVSLLATREAEDPLKAFCTVGRELGYELYPMELVAAGEAFHAQMKRSTNGGGENSPKLDGEDDFYELFLAALDR